jgi:acetyl esterase/lipase
MADLALQRLQVRTMLALPTPILRALSGGRATHVGGRTLDPRLQFLTSQAQRASPEGGLEEARASARALVGLLGGRPEPGVRVDPLSVPGAAGEIDARAYRPPDQDPAAPLMVFAHFGGGVIGDLDTCHAFCTLLAKEACCAVLSIAYRLAPEHRFPAGLEDMLAAYRWASEEAERFGAPAGRAAIGGDSMGGNFAAILCQELKRGGAPQPAMQLLIYPALDVAAEGGSMITYGDAWPLTAATMQWFMGQYLGPEDAPSDPRLSPLRETDLSGSPRR